MIDFDHNATAPVHPRVREAVRAAWDEAGGNPSSLHAAGRAARSALENARRRVAEATRSPPLGVTFTSGGTEANALGIEGAHAGAPAWVVTTTIEHASVRGAVDRLARGGASVRRVTPDSRGVLDPARVAAHVGEGPGVVAVTLVNAELGNVLDLAPVVDAVRARSDRAWIHVDAVQAFGRMPLDWAGLAVDSVALSGHKIGGPPGTGALLHDPHAELAPRWAGGAQERGRRPGTEAVPSLVGFGVAAELAGRRWAERAAHVAELRARMLERLSAVPGLHVEGAPDRNIGNTVLFRVEGCTGELLMMSLDLSGFCVSTGSACSVGSFRPSPVLLGLGRSDREAREAVRVSFGPSNTMDEIDAFGDVLPGIVERVRGRDASGSAA